MPGEIGKTWLAKWVFCPRRIAHGCHWLCKAGPHTTCSSTPSQTPKYLYFGCQGHNLNIQFFH